MLQFSDQALATIHNAIKARPATPKGLRVGVIGSACSGLRYVIRLEDAPGSEDQVIHCQGISLFVDIDSVSKLQGVKIDFVDQGERRGFTFDNPNSSQGCSGCNKSQSEDA
jgi:iron-sulfur cluster assembly protein